MLSHQLDKLGHDIVLIIPGSIEELSRAETLVLDIDELRKLESVEMAGAVARTTLPFVANQTRGFLTVLGLTRDTFLYADRFFDNFELVEGQHPRDSFRELLITRKLAADFSLAVGDSLTLRETEYRVVGIVSLNGDTDAQSALFLTMDELVFLGEEPNQVNYAWAEVRPDFQVTDGESQIRAFIAPTGQSFTVQSSERVGRVVDSILRVIRVALSGVGAIALLVGILGLMNTMFMAVLERTREVGVYMALGARTTLILTLFVLESALLSLIGGLIGFAVGIGLSSSIAMLLGPALGLTDLIISIDFSLFLVSLLLSILLGLIAGVIPSVRAANLSPITSLRYE